MKPFIIVTVCLLLMVTFAWADWDESMGHKMHYPQTPKIGGWDVGFIGSKLADDWKCSGTGPVSDIHFWVSWQGLWSNNYNHTANINNTTPPLLPINISIYSNLRADDPQNPYDYSVPLEELWSDTFLPGQYVVKPMTPVTQGWHDPSALDDPTAWQPDNHDVWDQINITSIENPFTQVKDEIYWLMIDFGDNPDYPIGWKQSGEQLFEDDAVWWDPITGVTSTGIGGWKKLEETDVNGQIISMDLAFVITPEPCTLLMLTLGSVTALRIRRRNN